MSSTELNMELDVRLETIGQGVSYVLNNMEMTEQVRTTIINLHTAVISYSNELLGMTQERDKLVSQVIELQTHITQNTSNQIEILGSLVRSMMIYLGIEEQQVSKEIKTVDEVFQANAEGKGINVGTRTNNEQH